MFKKFPLTMGAALAAAVAQCAGAARGGPARRPGRRSDLQRRERLGLCVRFLQRPALHLSRQRPFRALQRQRSPNLASISAYTGGEVLVNGACSRPTSDMSQGALEGDYVGASAQVTAGLGVGANVAWSAASTSRSIFEAAQRLGQQGSSMSRRASDRSASARRALIIFG